MRRETVSRQKIDPHIEKKKHRNEKLKCLKIASIFNVSDRTIRKNSLTGMY